MKVKGLLKTINLKNIINSYASQIKQLNLEQKKYRKNSFSCIWIDIDIHLGLLAAEFNCNYNKKSNT